MADRVTHVANFFETELTRELGPTDLVAEVLSTGELQSPAFLVIEPDDPNQREVILFDGAFTDTQFRATSIANRYLGGSAQPGGLTHPAGSVVRSAPLAQHIQDLNDRIDAPVTTDKIANNAVTSAKIANASVSQPKLAAEAVTWSKIADGAVITSKLADGAVTAVKIADQAVTTRTIRDGHVSTSKIADQAVTQPKLAAEAVTWSKIADGAVITDKIRDEAVTTAKIAPQAVTTSRIASENVTTSRIAPEAVTFSRIAGNAIAAFERSGATVEAGVSVPTSVGNLVTVALNIPSVWSSWDCVAFAQATADTVGTADNTILLNVRIDGTDGAVFRYRVPGPGAVAVAAASFRSGITTTGTRTIALRGNRVSSGGVSLPTVFLYVRAFRTS